MHPPAQVRRTHVTEKHTRARRTERGAITYPIPRGPRLDGGDAQRARDGRHAGRRARVRRRQQRDQHQQHHDRQVLRARAGPGLGLGPPRAARAAAAVQGAPSGCGGCGSTRTGPPRCARGQKMQSKVPPRAQLMQVINVCRGARAGPARAPTLLRKSTGGTRFRSCTPAALGPRQALLRHTRAAGHAGRSATWKSSTANVARPCRDPVSERSCSTCARPRPCFSCRGQLAAGRQRRPPVCAVLIIGSACSAWLATVLLSTSSGSCARPAPHNCRRCLSVEMRALAASGCGLGHGLRRSPNASRRRWHAAASQASHKAASQAGGGAGPA